MPYLASCSGDFCCRNVVLRASPNKCTFLAGTRHPDIHGMDCRTMTPALRYVEYWDVCWRLLP